MVSTRLPRRSQPPDGQPVTAATLIWRRTGASSRRHHRRSAACFTTLQRPWDGHGQPTKLVSVYDHAHQLVLTQAPVVAGDELAAFSVALNTLPELGDVLITADASHCQRAHAASSPSAAGTICSPSRAISRCCAPRCSG